MSPPRNDAGTGLIFGTDQNVGKRANQEDRFLVQEFQTSDGRPAMLALVADGIGGHNKGEVASEMARTSVAAHLAARAPAAGQMAAALCAALGESSQDIYAASLADDSRAGMGTTCTAAVIVDRQLYLAHVGDSRAYLIRGDEVRQLSIDHTWAEEAIRAGRSPDEIRTHPNRGVIKRYLGIDPSVEIDTRYRLDQIGQLLGDSMVAPLPLHPGDTIVLCSDGMGDVLTNTQIQEGAQRKDLYQAARGLVTTALAAGTPDNVTAVVLRVPGGAVAGGKFPIWAIIGLVGLAAIGALVALLLLRPRPGVTSVQPASTDGSAPPTTTSEAVAAVQLTQATGGLVVEAVTTGPGTPTVAAAAGDQPTIIPTPTPTPTRVPPTRTPTPPPEIETAAAPIATGRPTTAGVRLMEPGDGVPLKGTVFFKWQDESGFELGPDQRYELVFWKEGQEPLREGLSPSGAGPQGFIRVDLQGADEDPGDLGTLVEPGRLYWGVRLVGKGNAPIRMLSEGRAFVFERQSAPEEPKREPTTAPAPSPDV
jgi:protein phosphatase